jgi:hypothetical protein
MIVFIFYLLTGCTININIGNSDKDPKKDTDGKSILAEIFKKEDQTKLYESRAIIYLTQQSCDYIYDYNSLAVASQLMKDCGVILQSEAIQKQIHEEYPDVEYTLSLEATDEIELCTVIATSEDPEYLEEICNMAIDLLGEKVADLMGLSCNVVTYAGPAQEIETN